MTAYSLIRRNAHRVMPWKNGGGATAEIAIHPPGATVAAGFDWRLSIATVASDGPFSAFPRHDRVIMLLAGQGMSLTFDDGERAVLDRPFQPLSFSGDRAASCRLIGGPCEDLNLMVARDAYARSAAVAAEGEWLRDLPRDATRILVVLRGAASCHGNTARPLSLAPRDALVISPGETAPDLRAERGSLAFVAVLRLPSSTA